MTAPPSLRVVTSDPTPPYEQLRRQFVQLIQGGAFAPGDRLPPLRQLAADLGLAVGTVARTYRELETAGLVASRRGGGTRVRSDVPRPAGTRAQALRDLTEAYVRECQALGAEGAEIRAAVAAATAAPGSYPAGSSRGGRAHAGVPPGSR